MSIADELVDVTALYDKIVDRVVSGSLDPIGVKQTFEDILEGRLPIALSWSPPSWWRDYDSQIIRARRKFGDIWLPSPPKHFRPRPGSKEVPLLHVPATFDVLWRKVDVPHGYTKERSDDVIDNEHKLRLMPNKREYTEPIWLAFDPEHGHGDPPREWSDLPSVAASEVFSALIQFPDWCFSWPTGSPAPNLSGYQVNKTGDWSHTPYVALWDSDKTLVLSSSPVGSVEEDWASPLVREC